MSHSSTVNLSLTIFLFLRKVYPNKKLLKNNIEIPCILIKIYVFITFKYLYLFNIIGKFIHEYDFFFHHS